MKKILLFIAFFLGMHFLGKAQAIMGWGYYTDVSGNIVIRLKVTPPANPYSPDLYVANYGLPAYVWGTGDYIVDADGINYDYLVGVNAASTDVALNTNTPYYNPNYYVINSSYVDLWDTTINQWSTAPITSGIYEDPTNTSNAIVKLVFDQLFYDVNPSIYIWVDPAGTAYPAAAVPDFDGVHWDYSVSIPKTDISSSFSNSSCYNIWYYNNYQWYNGSSNVTDPTHFAASVNVCPLCSSAGFVYSMTTENSQLVHFVSPERGSWNFRDGSTSGTQTYFEAYEDFSTTHGPGSYTVDCDYAYGSSPNTYFCNRSREICVPSGTTRVNYYGALSSTTAGYATCDGVNFTAEFDNNNVVTVTSDFIFANLPFVTANFDFGDGSTPVYYSSGTYPYTSIQHTYSSSTDYNITLTYSVPQSYYTGTFPPFNAVYSTCVVTLPNICGTAKHAPTSITKTMEAIDQVKIAPNPASDLSFLTFTLQNEEDVKIIITDAMGRAVSHVLAQKMSAGDHRVELSTSDLAAGVYNVTIQTNDGFKTEKLSVVK